MSLDVLGAGLKICRGAGISISTTICLASLEAKSLPLHPAGTRRTKNRWGQVGLAGPVVHAGAPFHGPTGPRDRRPLGRQGRDLGVALGVPQGRDHRPLGREGLRFLVAGIASREEEPAAKACGGSEE